MGHIKYNETSNFQEKKCGIKGLKYSERRTITTVEYTEALKIFQMCQMYTT